MAKRRGRRKGSRNKGYFYRRNRGWCTKKGSLFVPLTDEHGQRLRDRATPDEIVKDAYHRWCAESRKTKPAPDSGATVLEVCSAYLAKAQADGAAKTHYDRADTLFDFCFGLPPEFRAKNGKAPKQPTAA